MPSCSPRGGECRPTFCARNNGGKPPRTRVRSVFVHFDPGRTQNVSAVLSFEPEVLAVIVDADRLDTTDALFGISATTYPAAGTQPSRGLETDDDSLAIGSNRHHVLVGARVVGNDVDQFRVLLADEAS